MSKFILESILCEKSSNVIKEKSGSIESNFLSNNQIQANNIANTSCYICNKHIDNSNINKCEKCQGSVCDSCMFFCKNSEISHKIVYCKNCFSKCSLCGEDENCIKCLKYCKGRKCSTVVCLACFKPNKHLYFENCNSIDCDECNNKSLCILTTLYCSNCYKRYCFGCYIKAHQHKINK